MDSVLYNETKEKLKIFTNQDLELIKRKLIHINDPTTANGLKLRIMQWNVFAQGFTSCSSFVLCPKEALLKEYRSILHRYELLRYDADIICTQETDLFNDFLNYLNEGKTTPLYKGTFFAKPNSACIRMPDNYGKDGHAIFYRSDKFNLVEEHHLLFEEFGNHGALFAKFQSIEQPNSPCFGIICTHLKAKEKFFLMRQHQGDILLENVAEMFGDQPIIICGDFNATPDEAVMKTMLSSNLNFDSAYKHLDPDKKEPNFTTWKFRGSDGKIESESCHTIDYILFRRDKVELLDLFELPSKEEIGETALPNFRYPSDHLSLIADFHIK